MQGRVAKKYKKARLSSASIDRAVIKEKLRTANFVDHSLGVYFQNAGSIDYIFPVARGTTDYERTSKKIMLKSLQIHGIIAQPTAFVTTPPLWATLFVIYDRSPTGTVPAVTDVLTLGYPYALPNDANSGRFRIVMRRTYTSDTASYTPPNLVEEFIDMRGMSTVYDNTGSSAIANVRQGALYIIHNGFTPSGLPAAEMLSSALNMRLRFINV